MFAACTCPPAVSPSSARRVLRGNATSPSPVCGSALGTARPLAQQQVQCGLANGPVAVTASAASAWLGDSRVSPCRTPRAAVTPRAACPTAAAIAGATLASSSSASAAVRVGQLRTRQGTSHDVAPGLLRSASPGPSRSVSPGPSRTPIGPQVRVWKHGQSLDAASSHSVSGMRSRSVSPSPRSIRAGSQVVRTCSLLEGRAKSPREASLVRPYQTASAAAEVGAASTRGNQAVRISTGQSMHYDVHVHAGQSALLATQQAGLASPGRRPTNAGTTASPPRGRTLTPQAFAGPARSLSALV